MKAGSKKRFNKMLAVFMALFMLTGMMPQTAFADTAENEQVRVIVENNIWTEADGAPWSGTLADQWVEMDEDTTLMSALADVLESAGQERIDEDASDLTVIKGLANGAAGADCKWTASVNSQDINGRFADYSVARGTINNGDVIRIAYDGAVTVNDTADDQRDEGNNSGDASKDEEGSEDDEESEQQAAQQTNKSRVARSAAVNTNNGVRVIVENTVYSKAKGAAWDGTLVDTWVKLEDDSTMMSCLVAALNSIGATQTGAENNYVTEINGLIAGSAGGYDGWMGTLNDWFTNNGFGYYTVADGTLAAGDEIRIMYSLTMGEDLGGSWNNNDKTVNNIVFSAGQLDKTFDKETHEYILTVPEGTEEVVVTPTATNKNFLVKTFVGDKEYKRTAAVPVSDGTVITVKCGDPEWPSMNGGTWGSGADSIPAETYTINVKLAKAEKKAAELESLIIHTGTSPDAANALLRNAEDPYNTKNVFSADKMEYDLGEVNDTVTQLRFRAKATDAKVTLHYGTSSKDITGTSGSSKGANCMTAGKNTLKIVVTPNDMETQEETTYIFTIDQIPTLTALSASVEGTPLYLDKTFAAATKEYTLTVPKDAKTVDFAATPKGSAYKVLYDGNENSKVDITGKNAVKITVSAGEGENQLTNTYTVNLNRVKNLGVSFKVTPEDAVVKVYDQKNVNIAADEDGVFYGMFGNDQYTYTITKYGYVSASGEVPAEGGLVEVSLEKAPDDGLKDVEAYWENFRNSDTNMGITNAQTPISAEDTTKLWNVKLGSGWSANPSVQIIVDDALIVMSGTTLYKLDLESGEILAQGSMAAAPNFGYTPPSYAEGMIFCPLSGGTVQAFNAETLESLWIYKDASGGQSLSPITYADGYIYTGFWNGENKAANYICISVTDEDPSKTDEAKLATWKHAQNGGFYWAGSVAIGDAVIVGTDDGASGSAGNAQLYSFDKETGEVISCIDMSGVGDQRSTMAYDKESGRVFFTTKGGYLCSAVVDAVTGKISDLKKVDYNAQSTSTPVVYKGKVYFATGSGISSTGSSGNIVVADASTLEMHYAVGLKGYPQCSLLMSTAYEDETGYIYLYSTYNNKPGGISMLKVKPEATTAAEADLIELYNAEGFEQYCITSIICGADGTLYYKNDSGNVFAIGVPDSTVVKNLIEKIGDAEDITLESENDIEDAREAYDALSEDDKAKVPNYDKLVAAEAALYELQIDNVESLIDAIGTVVLESEAKITAAREAYDSLSEEQKTKIANYDKLTAAEAVLKKLKEEKNKAESANKTTTKSITKSASIKLSDNAPTEEELAQGRENHYCEETGVDARDNSNDILPWYIKLNVVKQEITDDQKAKVSEALGGEGEVFILKDIHFTNNKDGSEWQPTKPVKIKIPMVDIGDYENAIIVHITDDGKIELIKGTVKDGMIEFEADSFSLYGIAGTNTSINDLLGVEDDGAVVWPWIVIAIIALVAIAYLVYRRKREA